MKNLIKKYGISEEKLKEGIDIVGKNLGLICDVNVMMAVTELLAEGDIKPQTKPILIRDICNLLASGHLMVWEKAIAEDTNDIVISTGTIEDEEILNREVKSLELVDDIYLNVQVY